MRQVFIKRSPEAGTELDFERKLYVIRKRAYNEIRTSTMAGANTGTCEPVVPHPVYKGMLLTTQLDQYFPTCTTLRSRRRWRWCTRASAPTPSRAGTAPTPTVTSPTTARSTRCAATRTGCTPRGALHVRVVREEIEKIRPIINRTGSDRACSTTRSSCCTSPAARCRTP